MALATPEVENEKTSGKVSVQLSAVSIQQKTGCVRAKGRLFIKKLNANYSRVR